MNVRVPLRSALKRASEDDPHFIWVQIAREVHEHGPEYLRSTDFQSQFPAQRLKLLSVEALNALLVDHSIAVLERWHLDLLAVEGKIDPSVPSRFEALLEKEWFNDFTELDAFGCLAPDVIKLLPIAANPFLNVSEVPPGIEKIVERVRRLYDSLEHLSAFVDETMIEAILDNHLIGDIGYVEHVVGCIQHIRNPAEGHVRNQPLEPEELSKILEEVCAARERAKGYSAMDQVRRIEMRYGEIIREAAERTGGAVRLDEDLSIAEIRKRKRAQKKGALSVVMGFVGWIPR